MKPLTTYSDDIRCLGFISMSCCCFRSMSGVNISRYGHKRTLSKGHLKDFTVATPEEFVKRFGGDHVINKASFIYDVNFYFHSDRQIH